MPFALDTGEPYPSLDGIDSVLNNLLKYCGVDHVAVINSVIAGVQAKNTFASINIIDNQANEVFAAVSMTIAGVVADVIANTLTRNEIKLLETALIPQIRETLLIHIGVSNHPKNYKSYVLPLINKGWLTMTIPDKPTSPVQKYLTTLKGRVVLNFLKMSISI